MKKIAFGLLFIVLGLGLLVASVAVLVESSLVRISLQRQSGDVSGTVEYRYCGVPVYWLSLKNVRAVEKRELKIADGATEGGRQKRAKVLTRAVFLDSEKRVLAWGEKTGLVNSVEPIQAFLTSDEDRFEYDEKPVGHPWDIFRERVVRGFFSFTLLVGGVICLLGGGGQLLSYLKPSRNK